MNRLKSLSLVFAFALLVLGVPGFASAQYRGNDDYYGRNRNQGNNYNNDLKYAIKQLKNQSKDFARQVDRELDRSRLDGSNREDRINDIAKDFKNAADRLEDKFDNGRHYDRSADEAAQVLNLGRRIEHSLSRARLSYGLQNNWNNIQRNLNIIANYYGGSYDNNRNNNNRNNNNRNRGRGNSGNYGNYNNY